VKINVGFSKWDGNNLAKQQMVT